MTPKHRFKRISKVDRIEAVLARCRIDANATHVHYDDSEGFIVYAEGGAVNQVRYMFKDLGEAYDAAEQGFSLRRFKWFD